ncbi:MAG: PleD family two-component system response regulator [Alphaproteobacteria bacterium]|jgi:two-component system cell cycle response regulator|nr:PleD family two-component system response regulator [Alphaproteobacteria bacterium]MCV6599716.1 PleD family two-component system response regulator [Alphaproteobacteria bacterium]
MFGKILVVDDSPVNLKLMEKKLKDEYYDVLLASSGEEALQLIEDNRPDLILLDVVMPGMNGYEVCQTIKNNPETFYLPVMMVTSMEDKDSKVKGLEVGADDILTKPVDDVALFARLNSLLRLKMMAEQWIIRETALQDKTVLPDHLDMYFGKKCKYSHIMVVGSDDKELVQLKSPLKEKRYKVIYTKNIDEVEVLSEQKKMDLFVISLSVGGENALRLSSKIKSKELNKNTPILIVGEEDDKKVFIKALEIGCNDYIVSPFNNHEYLARTYTQLKKNKYQQQLEKNYKKSLSLVSVDELTGLSNRRYLYSYLENMFEEMKTKEQSIAVLMIDIDDFKGVNDTYGHLIGDEVLVEFASRLKGEFRDFDLIARYGGDEFIAVIPYIDEKKAREIAERVRKVISDKPFALTSDPYKLDINISVGLTLTKDFYRTAEDVIEDADKALYEAKRTGRNKTCVCEGENLCKL